MKKIALIISFIGFCFLPTQVFAFTDAALRNASDYQGPEEIDANPFNAQALQEFSGTGVGITTNPIETVNQVIRVLLSFMGIGTIALMLYAGFLWMTAAGNDEAVTKAKKTLQNAVIGLVLIMSAYSLTIFVARRVQRESGSYGVGGGRFSGSASINEGLQGSFAGESGSIGN